MSAYRLLNVALLLVMPFLLVGLVNRVKSLWSGRRGPPIWQLLFDVRRLLRKSSVYSTTTTPVFRVAPYVILASSVASAAIVPLGGAAPLVAFPFDFVFLAYVWGLGRVAMMLAALDTGSPFEGMGAAREATFSTLIEPALFLVIGALGLLSGTHVFSEALSPALNGGSAIAIWAAAIAALAVVLQVEAARLPIDDPTTHLELTMVHEVMILDHSGPDLAALQLASAIKLFLCSAMIATLLNPWAGQEGLPCLAANVLLSAGVAVVVGSIESLIARLKLRAVPQYLVVAFASGVIALLATAWRAGGAP